MYEEIDKELYPVTSVSSDNFSFPYIQSDSSPRSLRTVWTQFTSSILTVAHCACQCEHPRSVWTPEICIVKLKNIYILHFSQPPFLQSSAFPLLKLFSSIQLAWWFWLIWLKALAPFSLLAHKLSHFRRRHTRRHMDACHFVVLNRRRALRSDGFWMPEKPMQMKIASGELLCSWLNCVCVCYSLDMQSAWSNEAARCHSN